MPHSSVAGGGQQGAGRRDSAAGAASSLHSSSTRPQADESRSWWSAGRSGTTKPHVHPAGQHLALRSRSVPLSAAASAARLRGDHRRIGAGLPAAGATSREAIVATYETRRRPASSARWHSTASSSAFSTSEFASRVARGQPHPRRKEFTAYSRIAQHRSSSALVRFSCKTASSEHFVLAAHAAVLSPAHFFSRAKKLLVRDAARTCYVIADSHKRKNAVTVQ